VLDGWRYAGLPFQLEWRAVVNCRGMGLWLVLVAAACALDDGSQSNEALRLEFEEHAIRRLDPDLLIGEVLVDRSADRHVPIDRWLVG
jgi:hypothetical protein